MFDFRETFAEVQCSTTNKIVPSLRAHAGESANLASERRLSRHVEEKPWRRAARSAPKLSRVDRTLAVRDEMKEMRAALYVLALILETTETTVMRHIDAVPKDAPGRR